MVRGAEQPGGVDADGPGRQQPIGDAERDRFRAVLDAMLDSVVVGEAVRDDDGRIVDFVLVFANRTMLDGAGRTADELIGRRVTELYPAWRDSGLFDRFVHVVETGEPYVEPEVRYHEVLPDGRVIDGAWSLQATRFGDGYITAQRDVTAALRAAEALRESREAELRARTSMLVLQEAALPEVLPVRPDVQLAARYLPATPDAPVGGDWYDAMELKDGRLGLVVADIAGHGPRVAGGMVQLRNKLRGAAYAGAAPGEVLGLLNQLATRAGILATCCYVVVDPGSGVLRWANAGHLPPVLVRAGEATVLAGRSGPLFGVLRDARYATDETSVLPGDALALFTDGLVERRTESIDVGIERFARSFAGCPLDDLDAVCTTLLETNLPDRHVDDACLLVARLLPVP